MKIVLIYNPHSGSALSLHQLRRICNQYSVAIEAAIKVDDNLSKNIAPYIKKKAIIAAIGGDGTLSSIAGLVAGSNATFAPLPGGTLNHFTKDLGISQDINEAIKNLTSAKPRFIDVGSVNDTVFINNSSIGLYPSSLSEREDLEAKKLSKWPAAVIASIRAFVKYRTYTVTIGNETFKTPFLFVGNNDYHLDNLNNPGRSTVNKGVLSVYTVASSSRLDLIELIGWTIAGRLKNANEIRIWKTKSLTIHTKRQSIRLSRDGELERTQSPLRYKIREKSLKIIGG